MRIWVDADACPRVIKEILFRAAERKQVLLTLVANHTLPIPKSPLIRSLQVEQGFDVADDYIVAQVNAGDLVITYSDGVVDEEDANEEPFGRERLLDCVNEVMTKSSADIRDHVLSRVQGHAAAAEAVDDTTLVVIRRLENPAIGTLDAREGLTLRTGSDREV